MNDNIVLLEWSFSPPDYFEEPVPIKHDDYTMIINKGHVEARIDAAVYDRESKMHETLHDALNDHFLGIQLLTFEPYTLSKASMHRLHPDGRKDFTIFAEPSVLKMSIGKVDIRTTDKDGNIISDSRKERVEKKKRFAELVGTYHSKDSLLDALLISFNTAVNDSADELVHLYEIREALATKFGGESKTRTALSISKARWSRLGQLANDIPVRQGRHRGKKVGELREATIEELEEARNIARDLITAYLEDLDR